MKGNNSINQTPLGGGSHSKNKKSSIATHTQPFAKHSHKSFADSTGESTKKVTNLIKSHPRPLILSSIVLVLLSVFFVNYSLTHADTSITLTINGGPNNNGKTITIDKNNCTTFTLDTITTTNNTLGYNMKAYQRSGDSNITIKKLDGTNISTDSSMPTEIINTTATSANDKQTTIYQACAGGNMADGEYSATIAYVLHENYAKVINGANFQDKTTNLNETCGALPTYPDEGSTITMTDTRNNQQYTVRKLKDNKCWMIDNLKLELTDGMILTPADTNVTDDQTVSLATGGRPDNSNFTTSNFLTRTGGQQLNDGPDTYTNFDAWRQVDPNTTNECQNNTSTISNNGNVTYNPNSKTGCGYLYNFYTATASAGATDNPNKITQYYTAPDSICPSGWKLPSGPLSSNDKTNDFAKLDLAYPPQGTGTSHADDVVAQGLWLSAGAWQGTFSGYYTSDNTPVPSSQGLFGGYWSSSVQSRFAAYVPSFRDAYVNPGNSYYSRVSGYAVRCLVG
ncbi:MAG: fibrobacter succinogenes major paralogous domain-containing protein [Candidatus Nomurabacteria bacterium]|jgi:uncharacterized protein (TIGR02145 family)|nr:fibrobacter succinogenes major paralogous domain-containing protein [Candidatus Nomurabacteria bacterium]